MKPTKTDILQHMQDHAKEKTRMPDMETNLYPLTSCPTRILYEFGPSSTSEWMRSDKNIRVGGYENKRKEDAFLCVKRKSKPLRPEQVESRRLKRIELLAYKAKLATKENNGDQE